MVGDGSAIRVFHLSIVLCSFEVITTFPLCAVGIGFCNFFYTRIRLLYSDYLDIISSGICSLFGSGILFHQGTSREN